jgi:hypothetical protein
MVMDEQQDIEAELNRIATELGKPPRSMCRITLPPDSAERLIAEMRLKGIEVVSNAMLGYDGERRAIVEYTDGTVEMHARGKVIPLGKRTRDLWPYSLGTWPAALRERPSEADADADAGALVEVSDG